MMTSTTPITITTKAKQWKGDGGRIKWVKGVKHLVMEGDQSLGGEHKMQYVDYVLQNYVLATYIIILTNVTPIYLIKKKKKNPVPAQLPIYLFFFCKLISQFVCSHHLNFFIFCSLSNCSLAFPQSCCSKNEPINECNQFVLLKFTAKVDTVFTPFSTKQNKTPTLLTFMTPNCLGL